MMLLTAEDNGIVRVANVIEEGRYGGPQSRIASVVDRLNRYEFQTTVILPKKNSKLFYLKLQQKGIKAHCLPLHRLTRDIRHLMKYFLFFVPEVVLLVRILKRGRVDLVHCNGSWQIKGIIAGKIVGAKVAWHLNDTDRPKPIKIMFSILARKLCDGFIFAGDRVEEYYLGESALSAKPYFQIQAPVDTQFVHSDKVDADELLTKNYCYNIVTIGNINRAKGYESFIEMAHLINEGFKRVCFFIVGQNFPEQRKYFHKLVSMARRGGTKNIFFRQEITDVRPILKAADIYVCSSIHEASPISVWEAMAMGKPIVATDVGDVGQFITDGEDGFIVQPRDSKAMAEKVEILLKDGQLRRKFSKKVRKTAIECLDIDICVKKHSQAYHCILNMKS